jgi:hypothetical protein
MGGTYMRPSMANPVIVRAGSKKELKYLDNCGNSILSFTATPPNDTNAGAGCFFMTNIATGSAVQNRDGTDVLMNDIRLNYTISAGSAAASASLVRCVCVLDRFPNSTTLGPSVAGQPLSQAQLDALWLLVFSSDATAAAVASPQIPENKYRFTVLYDQCHSVSVKASDLAALPVSVIVPIRTHATYTKGSSSGNNASEMTRGAIYLFFISNLPYSANVDPLVTCYSRLTWYDV